MKQPVKLSDIRNALETAVDAISEIELRAEDGPQELSFEQRVIVAVRELDNGSPLKDYLDYGDVERAVKVLGDIYIVTGVQMPPDWN